VTVFHHAIDRLRSQEAAAGSLPFPVVVGNTLNGRATGIEAAVTLQPIEAWRASLAYTGQDVAVTRDSGSRDISGGTSEANDPAHQFALRNAVDLPGGVELDVRLRRVSALPNPQVPAYTELGFRLAWRTTPRLTLALTGEDMLHARHAEFNPSVRGFEEFERSVRVTMAIRTR
jgi:iron complex outermembrane receptor protein